MKKKKKLGYAYGNGINEIKKSDEQEKIINKM